MKKILLIIGFLLIATISGATTFLNETWDSGTPPSGWPCGSGGCGSSFDGLYAHNTDNCSSTGGPQCGLSTDFAHSGTKSFKMSRAANQTDVCDIGFDIPSNPTTLYIRGYYYFPSSDWSHFDAGSAGSDDTMVHFQFTNSAFSNTGPRVNLRDGGNFHLSGGIPTHYMGFLGQVDDQELWTDDGRTVMSDPANGYNILNHLDQWLCVEFKWQTSGGHTYLTQTVDGNVIATSNYAGVSSTGAGFNLLIQSGYTNMSGAWGTRSASFYWDDIVVQDTGPIGCSGGGGGGSGDATPPTVTAFTIPSTYTSLTVPISSFTATDNVGVTGFCITATNSSSGCSWVGSAPTSYTFSSSGSKTLYAWARDAAGNISSSVSDTVTITVAINGACGSATGQSFTALSSSSPNLCSAGTVASFSGSGPWTWGCNGSGGGTNTSSTACAASLTAAPHPTPNAPTNLHGY